MVDDRTERLQRGLRAFSGIMRGATPTGQDLEDLRALSPDELAEMQLLYAQGVSAEGPLRDERAVKLAYLVKHAPGAETVEAAIGQLDREQLEEFSALTADDLRGPDGTA